MHKQGDYKSQNNHCEQKSSATRAMNDNKSNDTNDNSKKKTRNQRAEERRNALEFFNYLFLHLHIILSYSVSLSVSELVYTTKKKNGYYFFIRGDP